MRLILSLVSLILLAATMGCGHASPLEPPWPPEPPVYREPPQVDQETLDWYIFLMKQPEDIPWYKSCDHDFLWGVLEAAYAQAVETGDDRLAHAALCRMGASGFTEFVPTLVSALENFPFQACNALGNMQSDYAVYTLIPYLDHEYSTVRDTAAKALALSPAYSQYPYARWYALQALQKRLSEEPEDWVRGEIADCINMLLRRIRV